jgi:YD repeat-containing protein
MSLSTTSRLAFTSVSITLLAFLCAPAGKTAFQPKVAAERVSEVARAILSPESGPELVAAYHGVPAAAEKSSPRSAGDQTGIREEIPEKFLPRYQQWKREFLATEVGRQQWAAYQNNPNFTLTVVVTRDNPEGGTTSAYKWNEAGKLVAATITLGSRLDAGVPNPVYFPVMNSLLPSETTRTVDGQTLAATKLAHEFGHVNRTAKGDPVLYQLQSRLMPQYNQIFLSNGRDLNDLRLIELARKMGGTPVEIWEDREYWGETNAMAYLSDRFAQDGLRCLLFSRIKHSVDLYAPSYEPRFLDVAQSTPNGRHCGW